MRGIPIPGTSVRITSLSPQGALFTAGAVAWSLSSGSWWPIVGWIVVLAILTPICIGLNGWSERQTRRLADDFPLDPEIQRKYGYRTYSDAEIQAWFEKQDGKAKTS